MAAQPPPGTPVEPPPDDATRPLILGRYRREATLGRGGFGEVFRAFDTRFPRTVAIKTLRPDFSSLHRARFLEMETRFEREAEAASRMGVHRNIVTVHDRDRDAGGTLYLIMEYVPGGTLRDRLRPLPDTPGTPATIVALPRVEALQITADVARGLHAAHVHRVVHRDVKPANIFLAAEGQAKIGDFGIAQLDDHTIITRESAGHPYTLLYASPEQMVVTSPLGPTTDQYSLGLVLFEMLTGMAYKDLTEAERGEALGRQPPRVAILVGRMTADEPRSRYGSLGEVVTAIEALGAGGRAWEAAETHPAPPPVQTPTPPVKMDNDVRPMLTPRPVSRRAVLVGIGSLAVAGGVGVALLRRPDDMTVGTPTSAATVVSSVAATVAPTVAPTLAPSVAATPSIVSPTAPATAIVTGPAITPLRTLSGHTDFVSSVAFAPDGRTLASGSFDSTVRLWRVSDGTLIRTITGFRNSVGGNAVYGVAFAPDGQTLASASGDKTIRLWRASDGMPLQTLTEHTAGVNDVAFAPDGQTLASASSDKTVRLWQLR